MEICSKYASIAHQLAQVGERTPHEADRFSSSALPEVSIGSYVERIWKYTNCSESSLVQSLIYIDRLIDSQQGRFVVHGLNVHRLILVTIMSATKFSEDKNLKNGFWSKVGGVTNSELNILEASFLFAIKFNLWVNEDLFDQYHKFLTPQAQLKIQSIEEEEVDDDEAEADDEEQVESTLSISPKSDMMDGTMEGVPPCPHPESMASCVS